MLGLIYMFRNKLNDMKYVGKTSQSFNQRLIAHLNNTEKYMTYIDRALKKYGKDNFEFIIIEENIPNELLNEKEKYYISYYDSYNNGYNLTLGGSGALKYDDTVVSNIYKSLIETDLPMYVIAENEGVGYGFVRAINFGTTRKKDSYSYPLRKIPFNKKYDDSVAFEILGLLQDTEYSAVKISEITDTNIYFVYDVNRGRVRVLKDLGITFPIRKHTALTCDMTLELALVVVNELKTSDKSADMIGKDLGISGYTVGGINRGTHSICKLLNETFPIRKTPHRDKVNATNLLRKLSDSDLKEIIYLLIHTTVSIGELANRYGVDRGSIGRINNGKTFAYITHKYKLPIRQNYRYNKDVQL